MQIERFWHPSAKFVENNNRDLATYNKAGNGGPIKGGSLVPCRPAFTKYPAS